MKYPKMLCVAAVSTMVTIAAGALAQVKIALDSPPNLEGSGSYVWAHTFSTYLNENGMAAEEFQAARWAAMTSCSIRCRRGCWRCPCRRSTSSTR